MADIVRAVLFDLDGTLADSITDITASTNVCLAAAGLPTHDEATVQGFVGHGIAGLVEQALGEHATAQRVRTMLGAVRSHYREHCTVHTRLYPGIEALLRALDDRGIRLGVVSNKPHDMTVEMVATLMPDVPFGFVTGERSDIPRKPDPTGILTACQALRVPPASALYVGDTPVDVQAARAAGLRSVAVTWGFRDRDTLSLAEPDLWATSAEDILAII